MPNLPTRRTDRLALGLVAAVMGLVLVAVFIASHVGAQALASPAALPTAPATSSVPSAPASHAAEHDDDGDDPVRGVKRAVGFAETYRYADGVTVKVRVLEHGEVAAKDAHGQVGPHEDYVQLEARLANGGHHAVKGVHVDWVLTYGPKEQEAIMPRLTTLAKADKGLTGSLKPGQVRVARETFVVPCLCQNQAVLELPWHDGGHVPAVFTGALK